MVVIMERKEKFKKAFDTAQNIVVKHSGEFQGGFPGRPVRTTGIRK